MGSSAIFERDHRGFFKVNCGAMVGDLRRLKKNWKQND
jgi:hypothetical protein